MKDNLIQTYEWSELNIGHQGFTENHRKLLLKLNELHGFNYLDVTSRGVAFKNYVGVVQVNNLTIEILPKADVQNNETNWRDVLLHMLRIAKKVQVYDKGEAHVSKHNFHLLEIYMNIFLNELSYLLNRGFAKNYRKKTANRLSLKGKLELSTHLTKNITHKERFYTTHQIYDSNNLIHQIIYYALKIVRSFSRSHNISTKANRLFLSFPEVDNRVISIQDFKKIVLTRKTKAYHKILKIAKVLIGNYSPNISKGKNEMIALLFNMDQLWEEYLFQSLKKDSYSNDYLVSRETKPLFTSESYFLKPDIIVQKGGSTYIFDAKWKQPKNYKASQQDLRQIYTYCKYWNSNYGLLLYPGDTYPQKFLMYNDGSERVKCRLVYLPVEKIVNNAIVEAIMGYIEEE